MSKDPSPGVTVFASHRRRHLQSETYSALVRILSLCGDHDRVSLSAQRANPPATAALGNVESVAVENVGSKIYCQADSASLDEENRDRSTAPMDSLVNTQLEGAVNDIARGSSSESSMGNGTGQMMSVDKHNNYSPRLVDEMVGENCSVVRDNNNETSLFVQGHIITAETAAIKEDLSISCADVPLEKLTDHSDFLQAAVDKFISVSHSTISVPLQENANYEEAFGKRCVEDAFEGRDENEEIIQGKDASTEAQLSVGKPELGVKGSFCLGNDHDDDLPRIAGNDLAGLGGQLMDADNLKPDVPEPFDVVDEFGLEDTVMEDLRMIFDDDRALVRADDGMTKVTCVGMKDYTGVDVFSPLRQSDLQDLTSNEQAHVDKGQEEVHNCSEKASERLYLACGGHASTTANATFGIDASVEVQQSDIQKLKVDEQVDVNNLQKESDNYSKKVNLLSPCYGHSFVRQGMKEKSLLSMTGSPVWDSEIQLNTVLGFSDGKLNSSTVKTKIEEVEEGEISDGGEGTGTPWDFSSCHEKMETGQLAPVQLSGCVPSMKNHDSREQPETNGPHVESFSSMSNNMLKRMGDATRSDMGKMVFETQSVVRSKLVTEGYMCFPSVKDMKVQSVGFVKEGEHSEAAVAHGISMGSNETVASEKGTDVDKKRKRSCLSEQRKEKRKIKKRKKRADKNRELGVKRLKLPPMLPPKPKPVAVCRHFLKGRCQEGGQCKFSHDAVPLTKSKPCCHFARNACMKGDDCPFDHDLSKYPCNNFASSGSCFRGNSCLFSHKVMPTDSLELSRDDSSKPKSAPKLPTTFSDLGLSKLAVVQGGTSKNTIVLCTSGSSDIAKQNSTGVGKSQTKSFERSLSISSASTSGCTPSSSKNVNSQGGSRTSGIALTDDKQMGTSRTPLAIPKGINFLSFGISPVDKPKLQKTISSGLALKLSELSSSLNAEKAEDLSQCTKACASNVMPKDSTPESIEVQSLGKALLTATPIAGIARSNFADRNMASSGMSSSKVSISASTSAQSSDFSTPSPVNGTSASAPRVLSTIFSGNAAGFKLFGGKNSIFPVAGEEISHGVSPDDATKSLRILDFLASVGRKR